MKDLLHSGRTGRWYWWNLGKAHLGSMFWFAGKEESRLFLYCTATLGLSRVYEPHLSIILAGIHFFPQGQVLSLNLARGHAGKSSLVPTIKQIV